MSDSENKPTIGHRLTAPIRWAWRQFVRLAVAYREDLRWLLPMLRWAVPGVVVIVGLFWLPFDLMPLGRMRAWIWEGDAQEFRNALWGISAAAGVLLAMVGILLNYVRTRAIDKQARTAEGRLFAEEEGRKTERYVRAVELLGHQDIAVRLGALYSLERLAKDSPTDQPTIIETIAAYVRAQSLRINRSGSHNKDETPEGKAAPREPRSREDFGAAVTIISRRNRAADGKGRIDLRNVVLDYLDLSGARLEDVDLSGASLQHTQLEGANLHRADLSYTALQSAEIRFANLSNALLHGARLQGAALEACNLRGANFWCANLKDVDLVAADLRNASLSHANLDNTWISGADFTDCRGLTARQFDTIRYDADMLPILPDELGVSFDED